MLCMARGKGVEPSAHEVWEQKLYRLVNSPVLVILNTVPRFSVSIIEYGAVQVAVAALRH